MKTLQALFGGTLVTDQTAIGMGKAKQRQASAPQFLCNLKGCSTPDGASWEHLHGAKHISSAHCDIAPHVEGRGNVRCEPNVPFVNMSRPCERMIETRMIMRK